MLRRNVLPRGWVELGIVRRRLARAFATVRCHAAGMSERQRANSSTQRPREAPTERQRGSAMSERQRANNSTQRPREAPTERQRGSAMSERASDSMSRRLREAPAERSEAER